MEALLLQAKEEVFEELIGLPEDIIDQIIFEYLLLEFIKANDPQKTPERLKIEYTGVPSRVLEHQVKMKVFDCLWEKRGIKMVNIDIFNRRAVNSKGFVRYIEVIRNSNAEWQTALTEEEDEELGTLNENILSEWMEGLNINIEHPYRISK